MTPSGCEHVDQSVDAEELDLSANQIAYARLCNAEELSSVGLSEGFFLDDGAQVTHQDGPDSEVLGLLLGEAQVLEHVPRGGSDLLGHGFFSPAGRLRRSANSTAKRARAVSIARCDVFCVFFSNA